MILKIIKNITYETNEIIRPSKYFTVQYWKYNLKFYFIEIKLGPLN